MKRVAKIFFLFQVFCLLILMIGAGYVAWPFIFPKGYVAQPNTTIHPRPETHQVLPGETVWDIYKEYYAEYDWGDVRYLIGDANGLVNDGLRAYQVIVLPEVE